MNEYEDCDIDQFVKKRVVIDCGDGIWGPFGGAELDGILFKSLDGKFYLDTEHKTWHFDSHDVVYIEEVK